MMDETVGQVPPVSGPVPAPVAQVAPGNPPPAAAHEGETANAEAARYRTQLRAVEKKLALLEADAATRQEADLSELQKAQKRTAELEAAHTAATTRARTAELKAAGLTLGGKLGVPADRLGLLVKLLQVDGGEVEFDDDGAPVRESLERVLRAILKEHGTALVPGPAAAPAPEAPAPLASGAPTNPPRVVPARFTPAQIEAMSPQEYEANRPAIFASLNGR